MWYLSHMHNCTVATCYYNLLRLDGRRPELILENLCEFHSWLVPEKNSHAWLTTKVKAHVSLPSKSPLQVGLKSLISDTNLVCFMGLHFTLHWAPFLNQWGLYNHSLLHFMRCIWKCTYVLHHQKAWKWILSFKDVLLQWIYSIVSNNRVDEN